MRSSEPWGRGRRKWAAASAVLILLLASGLAWLALDLIPDPLDGSRPAFRPSIRVADRNGRLLREILSTEDTRSEWTHLADISPHLIHAAIAGEDKRFYRHPGVDPAAVLRSIRLNTAEGRIVSGASTITMQLARLLEPGPRTLRQKTREAVLALRLEKKYGKDRLLEEYLNRVPCGNLVHGLPAASRFYLNKAPGNLSPAEAAFLMALPQAPTLMNPYRGQGPALARRNRIITRMAALGYLTHEEAARARQEPLNLSGYGSRFRAPHFVSHIRPLLRPDQGGTVRTTLDLELQEDVERLTAQAVEKAGGDGISQAAVLVMNPATRQVLAWAGSADFFDPVEGQNDGVTALRQPGSTVKPFTYAVAFDSGWTPASMIDDSPVEFWLSQGVYRPTNYDGRFRGRISLRTALASSLNVPAVKLLEKTGLPRVYEKMKAAGLSSLNREPDYYGLGLTLGDGEVSLLELANAYATIASGGVFRPPVLFMDQPSADDPRQVFSPQAAYMITHILSDDAARATGFGLDSLLSLPFPAAAKTGTSKNFRDNWTVGYTPSVLVAVWAGNFDARPMGRVSGITGAGPLWRRVMRLAASRCAQETFAIPTGLTERAVCSQTGLAATDACPNKRLELFKDDQPPEGYCLLHGAQAAQQGEKHPDGPAHGRGNRPDRLAITNPRSGERYLFDPGIEPEYQNLWFKGVVPAGVEQVTWYVNNRPAARMSPQGENGVEFFWPLERGNWTIRLAGEKQGRPAGEDRVHIQVY